ncbi:hypothetical protein KKG45_04480 [bacterium]|nr:hypothetical protein [bacterium]MBU1072484.1 hypothetical protein [bacterium]MBU1676196.1 hypothetical protein [bacterium]
MKNWKCAFVAIVVFALAGLAVAEPNIGVYFDEAGTVTNATIEPLPAMGTGYLYVKNADLLVGGAAFAVDIDPGITTFFHEVPELGLYFGDLEGLEVGLYQWIPVFGPDDGALLGTFDFYSTTPVILGEITVGSHPNYTTPIVASSEGVQYEATGITTHLTIHSTPTIGIYFDEAGTVQHIEPNGGVGVTHTAYIMIKEAEMIVGGATFKLEIDPLIMLGSAVPVDALVLGSLTSGVEMGLYTYMPVFGAGTGLLYTIDLITFNNLMTDAPLTISNHPNYDYPVVADNNAYQFEADGLTSTMTIVVPTENKAWGDVKNLYQ